MSCRSLGFLGSSKSPQSGRLVALVLIGAGGGLLALVPILAVMSGAEFQRDAASRPSPGTPAEIEAAREMDARAAKAWEELKEASRRRHPEEREEELVEGSRRRIPDAPDSRDDEDDEREARRDKARERRAEESRLTREERAEEYRLMREEMVEEFRRTFEALQEESRRLVPDAPESRDDE